MDFLESLRAELTELREAGKVLSAVNRARVESIKDAASRVGGSDIAAIAQQMLDDATKSDVVGQSAEGELRGAPAGNPQHRDDTANAPGPEASAGSGSGSATQRQDSPVVPTPKMDGSLEHPSDDANTDGELRGAPAGNVEHARQTSDAPRGEGAAEGGLGKGTDGGRAGEALGDSKDGNEGNKTLTGGALKRQEPATSGNAPFDATRKADVAGKSMKEATLTAKERKALAPKDFAFTDAEGTGHLPIHDEAHVRAALGRFGQTQGMSAEDKPKVARRIVAAAKKHGIDVDPDSEVGKAAGLKGSDSMKEAQRSYNQLQAMVSKAIRDKYKDPLAGPYDWDGAYVCDMYDDYAVVQMKGKYFSVPWAIQQDDVVLGDPTEVVQGYVPASEVTGDGDGDGDDGVLAPAGVAGMSEACAVLEAVKDGQNGQPTGSQWDVMLIAAGWSKNGRYYPASVLQEAAALFEGAPAFADHATESERREKPERSIKDKIGRFSNVHFGEATVGGKVTKGLIGRLKIIGHSDLKETLKEAFESGESDFLGVSIDAEGKVAVKKVGGRSGQVVEAITKVHSVDVVTDPAAGGQIMRLVASNREQGEITVELTKEELAALVAEQVAGVLREAGATKPSEDPETQTMKAELAALKEARTESRIDRALAGVALSDEGKADIRQRFTEAATRRDFTEDELRAEVERRVAYEAAVVRQHLQPVSALRERVAMGDNQYDRYDKAMQGLLDGRDVDGVTRFRSLKEAYCRFTGADAFEVNATEIHRAMTDFGPKGWDSAVDHKRVRESLSTASWANIYADHLYLKLIRDYRAEPYSQYWRMLASEIEDVPDFQTRHWDRVGGYANLGAVAEQSTYPSLTSPSNEEATYSVSKYGGLDDVTFESIVNDRVGSIRRIPTAMARSAARTLWQTLFNAVTTSTANVYDGSNLYVAGHGSNNGSAALTLANMAAAIKGMRTQTAYGESSEILAERNVPKLLIVCPTLEQLAKRIVNPSENYYLAATADSDGSVDPAGFKSYGMQVYTYDVLSSTTGWYLMADPKVMETMVVGFLNGQQEPELFVQDQPNVGSAFTADKVTYKIRFIWGYAILDWRPFWRGNS